MSAVVKKCKEKETGKERAVKIFKSDDEEKLKSGINEYEIQKNLKHKNIIEIIDFF